MTSGRYVGPYELVKELGRGALVAVYLARHAGLRREIALKILMRSENPEERARFSREAKVASSLEHPGIVGCYDVGQDPERGYLYLALEYASGGTLAERMESGPLPPSEAVGLCIHLAEALAYAHGKSVLHRNLKAEDILFDSSGRALISDFGLATYGSAPKLTESGVLRGTPATLAPEQFKGGAVDQRADVYALGVILYQMLTGRLPYAAEDLKQLVDQIRAGMAPKPRSIQDGIPPAVESVCLRAMALDPEDRFSDMQSLSTALRASASSYSATERTPAVNGTPLHSDALVEEAESAVSPATLIASASMIAVALVASALVVVSLTSDDVPAGATPPPALSTPTKHDSPADGSTPQHSSSTPVKQPLEPSSDTSPREADLEVALHEIDVWNFLAAKKAIERARVTEGSSSAIEMAESELARAQAEAKSVTRHQRLIYRQELRGNDALREIERLLKRRPGSAVLRIAQADLLAAHGRYDDAVAALDTALQLDPALAADDNHTGNRRFLDIAAETTKRAGLRGSPPWKDWAPLQGGRWVQELPGQVRGAGLGLIEFEFAGLVHRRAGKLSPPYEVSVEIELDCTLERAFGGIVFGLRDSSNFLLIYLVHDLDQFEGSPARLEKLHAQLGDWPKAIRCAQMVNGRWQILDWAPTKFPDAGWTRLHITVEENSVTPRVGDTTLPRIPLSMPASGRVGVLKFYDNIVGFRDFLFSSQR